MVRIASIVEGHGEVKAVPILIRRLAQSLAPNLAVVAPRPIRVKRNKVLKPGELERYVHLAATMTEANGGILILLDADDDCPKDIASELLSRATTARQDRNIKVVLAKREYEAWFLAAADSIAGKRSIAAATKAPREPESIRGAKEWLSAKMSPGLAYRPTQDQASLTTSFDLNAARSAPSFEKLRRDIRSLLMQEPHECESD